MILNKVICVCAKADARVWQIASKFIVENIESDSYEVIVPDGEVNFFQTISQKPFLVKKESEYLGVTKLAIQNQLPIDKKSQLGWYLQQFIKLCALKKCNPNETVLIWDSDTIPLRKMNFIHLNKQLVYYKSNEHHLAYFKTIERLLGINKKVDYSFIAQCFPIKVVWFDEFCQLIENRSSLNWDEAILQSIDFHEMNSFSEYETLGTFISHFYPDQFIGSEKSWCRLGNSLIGDVAFLENAIKAGKLTQFDFISFEKWDRPKPYFLKVSLPYFFQIYLTNVLKNFFSPKI